MDDLTQITSLISDVTSLAIVLYFWRVSHQENIQWRELFIAMYQRRAEMEFMRDAEERYKRTQE